MKLFTRLYEQTLAWAAHRHADKYLALTSFSESIFFPVPPDVMLAPMALSKPEKAMYFALLTTLASVAGGVVGYFLGLFAYESFIEGWVISAGYGDKLELAIQWFSDYGVWVVFLAGFSPIPYKVFTISAGSLAMSFVPFLIASAIGRGLRFFMVAMLMKWGGAKIMPHLQKYMELIGWSVVGIVLIIIVYLST